MERLAQRSHDEIVREILQTINGRPMRQTPIQEACRLNPQTAKKYLGELTAQGLVLTNIAKKYFLTRPGREHLQKLRKSA